MQHPTPVEEVVELTIAKQRVIPAARSIKELEHAVKLGFEYVVMLQIHLAQVRHVTNFAHQHEVKVLLHADLVEGLKADEPGAQFLCQEVKPDGLISTHPHVVSTAMKRGIIGIQRVFLLDSQSLETSYRLVQRVKPDYLEVLPGIMTNLIHDIHASTGLSVLGGGFIRTVDHVESAIAAGAIGVTTSTRDLWTHYAPRA